MDHNLPSADPNPPPPRQQQLALRIGHNLHPCVLLPLALKELLHGRLWCRLPNRPRPPPPHRDPGQRANHQRTVEFHRRARRASHRSRSPSTRSRQQTPVKQTHPLRAGNSSHDRRIHRRRRPRCPPQRQQHQLLRMVHTLPIHNLHRSRAPPARPRAMHYAHQKEMEARLHRRPHVLLRLRHSALGHDPSTHPLCISTKRNLRPLRKRNRNHLPKRTRPQEPNHLSNPNFRRDLVYIKCPSKAAFGCHKSVVFGNPTIIPQSSVSRNHSQISCSPPAPSHGKLPRPYAPAG